MTCLGGGGGGEKRSPHLAPPIFLDIPMQCTSECGGIREMGGGGGAVRNKKDKVKKRC